MVTVWGQTYYSGGQCGGGLEGKSLEAQAQFGGGGGLTRRQKG